MRGPSFLDLNIESSYESGLVNDRSIILNNFYLPCISRSIKYDRATGFFSSSIFKISSKGIKKFVENNGRMRLITSPRLSRTDIESIKRNIISEESIITKNLEQEIFDENGNISDEAEFLGWMIKNNRLEIKLAIMTDDEGSVIDNQFMGELFHTKIGIMEDSNGNVISFTGSINESAQGWSRNVEEFDVFKNWDNPHDALRVITHQNRFNSYWKDGNHGMFKTTNLPIAFKNRWISEIPDNYQELRIHKGEIYIEPEPTSKYVYEKLWPHQKKGYDSFFDNNCTGILQMATGTGKTRLALTIAKSLYTREKIKFIVVLVPRADLVKQWHNDDIKIAFPADNNTMFFEISGPEYEKYPLVEYSLTKNNLTILCTTYDNYKKMTNILRNYTSDGLIICDEVHNLGANENIFKLKNEISIFKYRLGLSATPKRMFDSIGTEFIQNEIGEILFEYPLESAIKDKVLCQFYYYPIQYSLSNDEREKISKLMKKTHITDSNEKKLNTSALIQIANVYKSSINKYQPFKKLINEKPELLNRSIIYVHSKEYGIEIQNIILELDPSLPFKTYYGGESSKILDLFSEKKLNCLITALRINEGISINDIQTVFLISAGASNTETLQRIGRCLRLDPNNKEKIANIIDFVESSRIYDDNDNSIKTRYEYLSKIAKDVIE